MTAKKIAAKEATGSPPEAVFTREQAIKSKRYRAWRDVISVVLTDGETYTAAQIDTLRDEFLHHPIQEKINEKG